MIEEIHSLKEENERLKNRNEFSAIQERIKRLAEQLEEVEKNRLADNKNVVTKLEALSKGLSKPVTPKDPAPPVGTSKGDKSPTKEANVPPENGYTYEIKDGDTLLRIVNGLRAKGYKITQKQVIDANAGVNWNRLKIGQLIIIPPPAP
jgi:LysM repeat protein